MCDIQESNERKCDAVVFLKRCFTVLSSLVKSSKKKIGTCPDLSNSSVVCTLPTCAFNNCPFQAIMAQLPQEQKAKIAEQVASFQEEKSKLDAEVSKWDDSGNDIIVLAKQMCMIMMEMTDFTR